MDDTKRKNTCRMEADAWSHRQFDQVQDDAMLYGAMPVEVGQ